MKIDQSNSITSQPQESFQNAKRSKSSQPSGVAGSLMRGVTAFLAIGSAAASRPLRADAPSFDNADSFGGIALNETAPAAFSPAASTPAPAPAHAQWAKGVGFGFASFPLSVDTAGLNLTTRFGCVAFQDTPARPESTVRTDGDQTRLSDPKPFSTDTYQQGLPLGFDVFSGPSTVNDLRQGTLGNANFYASVAAVMSAGQPVPLTEIPVGPSRGGRQFEARFFAQGGKADPIAVGIPMPLSQFGQKWTVDLQTSKAWPGILAKAYYRYSDLYPKTKQTPGFPGWFDSNKGSPFVALSLLTGNEVTVKDMQTLNEGDLQRLAGNNNVAKVLCTVSSNLISSAPGFNKNTKTVNLRGITMQLFGDDNYVALSGPKFGDNPASLALGHCYALTGFNGGLFSLLNPQHTQIKWDLKKQSKPFKTDEAVQGVDFATLQNVGLQLMHVNARR